MKKIYRLIRTDVDEGHCPYDEYYSFIICAISEDDAYYLISLFTDISCWVKKEVTDIIELGIANDNIKIGIIDSNFNAG